MDIENDNLQKVIGIADEIISRSANLLYYSNHAFFAPVNEDENKVNESDLSDIFKIKKTDIFNKIGEYVATLNIGEVEKENEDKFLNEMYLKFLFIILTELDQDIDELSDSVNIEKVPEEVSAKIINETQEWSQAIIVSIYSCFYDKLSFLSDVWTKKLMSHSKEINSLIFDKILSPVLGNKIKITDKGETVITSIDLNDIVYIIRRTIRASLILIQEYYEKENIQKK